MFHIIFSNVYYAIFFICAAITILKLLLALVLGDLDFDVDADSVMDFDLGSIFSFKGILHFLLGASMWLSLIRHFIGFIAWYHYIIAAVIGIIFAVVLFLLYVFLITQLSSENKLKQGAELIGTEGVVNWTVDDYANVVISNNGERQTIDCVIKGTKVKAGQRVTIIAYEEGKYYI